MHYNIYQHFSLFLLIILIKNKKKRVNLNFANLTLFKSF